MNEVSIVLSGEAGKGLKTVEEMVTKILAQDGYNVYAFKEIMSRVRGGNNTTQLRVSNSYIGSYVTKTDYLFVFNPNALYRLEDRIQKETVVIGPKSFFTTADFEKYNIKEVEFLRLASEIGNPIYSNTIVMGMILGMINATKENVYNSLREKFSKKGEKLVLENIDAFPSAVSNAYLLTSAVSIHEVVEWTYLYTLPFLYVLTSAVQYQ